MFQKYQGFERVVERQEPRALKGHVEMEEKPKRKVDIKKILKENRKLHKKMKKLKKQNREAQRYFESQQALADRGNSPRQEPDPLQKFSKKLETAVEKSAIKAICSGVAQIITSFIGKISDMIFGSSLLAWI